MEYYIALPILYMIICVYFTFSVPVCVNAGIKYNILMCSIREQPWSRSLPSTLFNTDLCLPHAKPMRLKIFSISTFLIPFSVLGLQMPAVLSRAWCGSQDVNSDPHGYMGQELYPRSLLLSYHWYILKGKLISKWVFYAHMISKPKSL